ncbi:uncharacterized protein LAESUDRAFT_755384 [Laetiporus sulphureus 93-53]|uniref:F-box domain-containing protein n=1 Tax=Laetiporus sulphureus 93-53 TaxID=1314785 RepID=A0A165GRB6_9APHY|nr:uncharacterized protein LAESUDRAFT_755384 [Laetiporus sulphureus 93-53]KZT10699.1 hypothetical protein LAESUDRAFT_755384 [Laetiporus sulphureus 93-53]
MSLSVKQMGRFKTPLPGFVRRVERLFNGIACGRGQRHGGASARAKFPASSAVASMLPVELWEIIIACIWHDWSDAYERRRALSSCALTCRTFSLIVRQLVFHTIRLSQTSERPNYAHFVDILQHSPYVALLHAVETLILDFNGSTYEVAEHMRDKLTTYFTP